MTDWKVQYLISLEARDKTEKQHEDFYETCGTNRFCPTARNI